MIVFFSLFCIFDLLNYFIVIGLYLPRICIWGMCVQSELNQTKIHLNLGTVVALGSVSTRSIKRSHRPNNSFVLHWLRPALISRYHVSFCCLDGSEQRASVDIPISITVYKASSVLLGLKAQCTGHAGFSYRKHLGCRASVFKASPF